MASNKELRPEKLRFYLEKIAEAVLINSKNLGSLRKPIWSYVYKKCKD